MENTIRQILNKPDAPLILEELKDILMKEAERRKEFREWIDDSMKAEFINGELVMHSPSKHKHWQALNLLATLLSAYTRLHKLGTVGVEKVMISLTRNDYEPDIVFFNADKAAGFTKDQLLFPAPDFAVEILSSRTATRDKGIKKQDYAAHGVREYWIIDADRQQVAQHFLLEGDSAYMEPYQYIIDDDIESRVIKGFRIPVRAIFEEQANVAALQVLVK